jgi:arylsulfatase A
MNRRDFLKSTSALAAGAVALESGSSALMEAQTTGAKKPNILFILADDLGINGLQCYGADHFKTPNIDKLAQGGTRFTHAYTAPLCGPSRALILTGRYAFRTGATNQDATGQMKPSVETGGETMMPKILKQASYASAAVGKWGQLPLEPSDFEFDEYLKFNGSGIYWNYQDKGKSYLVNGKQVELHDKEYLPDVMHKTAVNFLERHQNTPFYLYYSMSHVHAEILPTPDSKPDSKDLYADNIAYMDKLVGKLIAELERLKLRDNTLVIFVGDNGTGGGYAAQSTIGGRRLSGEKGSMLEGGANVPLIVNWPGRTPAGKVSTQLIDSTDFVPTFAELTGAKLPQTTIDGHSFLPRIYGKPGKEREWIFIELARMWYVREQQWKLNEKNELYDMTKAPFEEILVPADTKDPAAIAARTRLSAALATLNPAGGILDEGDGTGRHANREINREKKKKKKGQ